MSAATSVKNAAFYYHPDGFETSRTNLMGRHAAGEGFLQGFCEHSGETSLYCYSEKKQQFEHFARKAQEYSPAQRKFHWIPWSNWQQLSEVGCLFVPGPDLSELAWQRRHGNQRAFSLFGITHTTASNKVMDGLGQLLIAPLQPWDVVVCTSQSVKTMMQHVLDNYGTYLKEKFGLSSLPLTPAQLPVIPLGINCASFDLTEQKRNEVRKNLRARLQIDENDFVALYVGRISFHAKAHPMPMYRGLELAAQRCNTKIHLIMSGWFANKAIEKEFAEGAKIFCPSVTVHFVDGRTSGTRQNIWHAADVFCSLSDNIQETFGLTPLEAMAAGLPVVVSNWDGYKETVREGVDGFRIPTWTSPPGQASDLALANATGLLNYDHYIGYQSQFTSVEIEDCAQAFQRLIEDPTLRTQMGIAGKYRARSSFDWSVIVRSYQKLWEELAELRQKSKEHCSPAGQNPANPLRDDPTALFSHYPSNVLKPDTFILLSEKESDEKLALIQSLGMNTLGQELRYSTKDTLELLTQLKPDKAITAQSLYSNTSANKTRALLYTIIWLAKMGVVRLVDGENE